MGGYYDPPIVSIVHCPKKVFFSHFLLVKKCLVQYNRSMKRDTERAEKSKFLTVKMTEGEVDRAREKAKKSGLTLSQVVRKLLNDYAKDEQFSLNF